MSVTMPAWKVLLNKTEEIKIELEEGRYDFHEEECKILLEGIKSMRSAQTRLSLQTLNLLLKHVPPGKFENNLDPIIKEVLLKSANDKKFISGEALNILETWSTMYPSFSLFSRLLRHGKSKNLKIVKAATQSAKTCAEKMQLYDVDNLKINEAIELLLYFMNCGSAEGRRKALYCVAQIRTMMGNTFIEVISATTAKQISYWENKVIDVAMAR